MANVKLGIFFLIWTWAWWFRVNPLCFADERNSQNIYRVPDSIAVIKDCFFDKSFGIISPNYIIPIREISSCVSNHFRVFADKVNRLTTNLTILLGYCKSGFFISVHSEVSVIHNQAREVLSCKYYLKNDTISFFKFHPKICGILTFQNLFNRTWISSFDIFNGSINIFNEGSVCFKCCIYYLGNTKTNFWDFGKIGKSIKIIEHRPYFTKRKISAGNFTISSNNNFISTLNTNSGGLSDSIASKNQQKEKIFKKPRYIHLTERGLTVEAVLGFDWPVFGLDAFDIYVSSDECKTWFHLFDDNCVNDLPNYFTVKDSLKSP